MPRTVKCAKLGRELPGLEEPPFDGPMGQKVFENISQEAWRMWMEHLKMVINEYRLNPANKQHQELILQHMEEFFFGQGAAPPPEYKPLG
ncbi:MAG TPA: oxidative damage protection protein [Terriglobales bacterium]|nr:oxidative damage protection protein [Terriglobales bacterium]